MSPYVVVVDDPDREMAVFGSWRKVDEAAAFVDKIRARELAENVEIRQVQPRTFGAVARRRFLFRERR